MSRKLRTTQFRKTAHQATALCVGAAACWLVAAFVYSPSRQLTAGVDGQAAPPRSIRLGAPTFSSAPPADERETEPQTVWQVPSQELQLIRRADGNRPSSGQMLIRPRKSYEQQNESAFRPASQSAAQSAGLAIADEYQRRANAEREKWSVPGRHDPWKIAESTEDEVKKPQPPASTDPQPPPFSELPKVHSRQSATGTQSPPGVGLPLPADSGFLVPESSTTVDLKPQLPAGDPAAASSPPPMPAVTPPAQRDEPPAALELPKTLPLPLQVPPSTSLGSATVEPPVQSQSSVVPEQPLGTSSPSTGVPMIPNQTYSLPVQSPTSSSSQQQNLYPNGSALPAPVMPNQSELPQPNQQFVVPQTELQSETLFAPPLLDLRGPHSSLVEQGPQTFEPMIDQAPGFQAQQHSPEVFGHANVQPIPHGGANDLLPPGFPPPEQVLVLPDSNAFLQSEFGHAIQPEQSFGHSMLGIFPGTSGFRATVESDAQHWMAPYTSRTMTSGPAEVSPIIPNIPEIPAGFAPWWDAAVQQSLGVHQTSHSVDVSSLLQDALVHSPQVVAIKTEPEVQYRVVTQEAAKFDWTAFLEATYDDLNDPVGSDLTTGNGEDRLLTRKVLASGGLRQRNLYGGEFRVAQDFGHENQNSRFFVPNNQGSARLELSYRQPLMDGSGRAYNESEIVLARIQANTSEDEVVNALQDHLTEVTEAYWTLYRSRAEFFQRQKLLASANEVLVRLEGRSQVDTIPRQVLRARAAVARSQTRIQRTLARVRDAEAQLRLLVNSPAMLNGGHVELMPTEPPRIVTETANLQSVLQTALINRADISEAIRKMRAAGVRLGVSKTELLPRLDLLVETYVADLAGNSNVRQAYRGQLLDNRPGYTIGLEFEVPLGNRAAVAKLEQREWELKRSVNIFRATVEKSLTDVEIANREVQTAYSEILSRYQSMQAADNESRYLKDRFEVLPAAEDSATLLLEDLLDSFERLSDEEASFVQAQVDHAVALIKLKKELGTLLRSRNSRPQLDGEQQVWMSQRVGDSESAMQPDYTISDGTRELDQPESDDYNPVSYSSSRPRTQDQYQTSNSTPKRDSRLLPIGYAPTSDDPAAGVPIPLTPTTWQRPSSQRRGAR